MLVVVACFLLFIQCDRTKALDEYFSVVEAKEENFVQNIAIIGAGCSVASLPIAEICHYYNMPIVSTCTMLLLYHSAGI